MLRCYPGTDLAWDTEALQWIKPLPPKQEPEESGPPPSGAESVHFTELSLDDSQINSFKSGFGTFDEKIGGIEPGEVFVITGHTKNGKTLFAESWIKSMMQKDERVRSLFFSFEVRTNKLVIKYLDNPEIPLYFPKELKVMDYEWLKSTIEKAQETHGINLVLIDHLHFLVDMNTRQNMSLNIGAFMRKLKQDIAIGLNLAVILIAHQGQSRDGDKASISNIRDSSFIAQEADAIISVHRRKDYDTEELNKFESKYGLERRSILDEGTDPKNVEDDYQMSLSVVTIERTRRTGVFEFKKLFKKRGNFLEEL